jgi:uncharacterized membrane protein YbhN (UPF0104 family)
MDGLGRKILLTVAFGAVVYLVLTIYGQWGEVAGAVRGFRWVYVPLLLGLACMNYLTRFIKWEYYLRLLGIAVPRGQSLAVFLSGLVMTVTPGKMGEVLKSFLLKEINGTAVSATAPVVVAERMSDLVALVVLSSVGLASVGLGVKAPVVGLSLVATGMAIISRRRLSLGAIGLLERVPFMRGLAARGRRAYESMQRLLRLKVMAVATLISVPAWFWECVAFYFVVKGVGSGLPLLKATSIYGFSSVAGALSMLPGGLGVMEGSLAALLGRSGVPRAQAVGATMVIRVCTLWFAVLVGAAAVGWAQRFIRGLKADR